MLIRSAVFEGTVAEAQRPVFDDWIRGEVREAMATYPGIHAVKLRWPVGADVGAPPIYVILDLYFDDRATMRAALASDARLAVRRLLTEIMPAFRGRVYHMLLQED